MFLESLPPIITMNNIGRMNLFDILLIAQLILRYDLIYACNIFKQCLAFVKWHHRKTLVAGNSFICQHTNDELTKTCRFLNDSNMTTMQNVCGKRHIHFSLFNFFQTSCNYR